MKIVASNILLGVILTCAPNVMANTPWPKPVCEYIDFWGFQETLVDETVETTPEGPLVVRFMEVNQSGREFVVKDSEGNRILGNYETYLMRYEERLDVGDYVIFQELLVVWTPDEPLTGSTYTLDAGTRYFNHRTAPTLVNIKVVDAPVPPAKVEPIGWEIGTETVERVSCDPLRPCHYRCTELEDGVVPTIYATFKSTESRSIARRLHRVTPTGRKELTGGWASDKGDGWVSDRPGGSHRAYVAYGSEPACFRAETLNLVDKRSMLGEIHCFDAEGEVIELESLLEVEPPETAAPDPVEPMEVPEPDDTDSDSAGCSSAGGESSLLLVFLGFIFTRRKKRIRRIAGEP